MTKLYLDVDGVLLTSKNVKAAPNGIAFLDNILSSFDCYWLTTHCKDGNTTSVLNRLSEYYPKQTIIKLQKVKPVKWDTLKTEAIDFSSSFIWLDDYVFEAEKAKLRQEKCLDRLVLVNLKRKNELLNICSNLLQL